MKRDPPRGTAILHQAAIRIGGPGSLYHPYECAHDETCYHCWRTPTDAHDPYDCFLCEEEACRSCAEKKATQP